MTQLNENTRRNVLQFVSTHPRTTVSIVSANTGITDVEAFDYLYNLHFNSLIKAKVVDDGETQFTIRESGLELLK